MTDVIHAINEWVWIGSNVLLAYVSVAIVIFVAGYYFLYDPRATTGGKFIFRFMLSLVGVIGLIFVGTFIDPSPNRMWFAYPGDVAWWRPIVRFAIYAYVAFSITSLSVLLGLRKWRPDLIKKASDLDLVKPRNTSEIPIIRND